MAGEPSDAQALIAARLRQTASAAAPSHFEPPPTLRVEEWMLGDAGHLHRAHDLGAVPLGGALGRRLRRLLAPLIDAQTSVNGANARVATGVLEQLAAQGARIEALERQVAELRAEQAGW